LEVVSVNRRPVLAVVLLASLLVTPAFVAPTASAVTGATTRVSVATSGTQANGESGGSAITADGRYVAFGSNASNLVVGDTNGTGDVFVRDRVTGATTRVSVATGGTQANGDSSGPAISADGRYVAFDSNASNLVAGDTNGCFDVFVHDRVTGATTRVSVATDGTQAGGFCEDPIAPSGSGQAAISADGRYVAFWSKASNLVAGDTNISADVFVHDRVTGATTRVSVASDGTQANNGGNSPVISADGRYVAFNSDNLVVGDPPDVFQGVFVRDRITGAMTRVSVATGGATANNTSYVGRSAPMVATSPSPRTRTTWWRATPTAMGTCLCTTGSPAPRPRPVSRTTAPRPLVAATHR